MSLDLARATADAPVRVGRYDVTGLIRRGGMGQVYDAVDREHGTRVALKTLTHMEPENLLRFKNEFRAVADLSHPNLVPLYELGCDGDLWFFTMERIDGVDFIEWVRGEPGARRQAEIPTERASTLGFDAPTGTALPPVPSEASPSLVPSLPRLRDALAQLVRGIRALHAASLLHLDVKPSNVLVDRTGRVVVLDFGLVRGSGGSRSRFDPVDEHRPMISGTPAWMAPEQFLGIGIAEPADWYAVGLMLYLGLVGVPAFPAASVSATWYAKQHLRPTPPDEILGGVPRDLSALAMALLSPDPGARPRGDVIVDMVSGAGAGPIVREQVQPGFVGRARERALLAAALSRSHDEGAVVVHVTGPSGVGKSALLDCIRDLVPDALVMSGRCYERETVPYKAFDGALDDLAAWLAARPAHEVAEDLPRWIEELSRVFPALLRVPAVAARRAPDAPVPEPVELRRRAVEALRDLVSGLAARVPVVVRIDDLQWVDSDSTAMLLKLVEAPARGLTLAVALRAEEAPPNPAVRQYLGGVERIAASRELEVVAIDVGPLPRDDAEALAAATLAALHVHADGLAARIAEESAGVPFFVEELAHHVAEHRDAQDETATRISLEEVLARRVRSLPDGERALVEVLSVANNPIPLGVAFSAAGIETGLLRALWLLQQHHFVRSTGAGAEDLVELRHDRLRESVLGYLPPGRIDDVDLALGRALAVRDAWIFDAVRHLNSVQRRLMGSERRGTAQLDLDAGRRARGAAAFELAFDCFSAGTRLLEPDAWVSDYELALGLHSGAAEAAYLSAAWGEVDAHIEAVTTHGKSVLDQLGAREVQIDAGIARADYNAALDAALEVLRLLHVDLPAHPGEAEIGEELGRATASLSRVGSEGLAALAPADDPEVTAAMRIQGRITSAAYFARPALLPVIACRLVATSVERGLSPATPYALAVYGIVLNTIGQLHEAHGWGQVALRLLDRFDDKSLDARTRHVVHDLVCVWTVPLAGTLDDLRAVVDAGKETGDLEYAGYAAHAWVHNSFYAARAIGPLLREALELGAFMRGYEQVNALHVHTPFEQALYCFAGKSRNPASLDGGRFNEADALSRAAATGSRSAEHILRLLMGIVRYHFGSVEDASACFEAARPFLDGVASTWHVPVFHQYAALAIHGLPDGARAGLAGAAETSLKALSDLAAQAPGNFAHRVELVEGERARAAGEPARALVHFERASAGAEAGGWWNDLGLVHERAAACAEPGSELARRHRAGAREAYARWGARAKVERLGWKSR